MLHLFVWGSPTGVQGQTNFQILKSFDGPLGSLPYSAVMEGSDGALYGTTFSGGSNTSRGTVFRMSKNGDDFHVLRHFASGAGGSRPSAGVIEGSDGVLYGTTGTGGSNGLNGTVFKMNKDGTSYAVVWHFTGTFTDGRQPQTGLIEGSDGFLYGTTSGAGTDVPGNVFRVGKDGSGFSVLHRFEGAADGQFPWGSLFEGSDGALYGTTYSGTTGSSIFGTLFKVNKDGSNYAILRHCDLVNGIYPYGGLIEASDRALYGTTSAGGDAGNHGTVFKVNKDGTDHTVIFRFTGDGSAPRGTLAEGNDGALYGVTFTGGIGTNGTAFKLNKDGSGYAVLHRFSDNAGDGKSPSAGLLASSDGAIYGTTVYGGDANLGTVFRLSSSMSTSTVLSISHTTTGALLSLTGGVPGAVYRIQATTNLGFANGWNVIGSNSAGLDGRFNFLDGGSSNHPARIYRSAIP